MFSALDILFRVGVRLFAVEVCFRSSTSVSGLRSCFCVGGFFIIHVHFCVLGVQREFLTFEVSFSSACVVLSSRFVFVVRRPFSTFDYSFLRRRAFCIVDICF